MTSVGLVTAVQAGATLALCGIAWFVQIVFYPAYPDVGRDTFRQFETQAVARVPRVVGPLMLAEAAGALMLAVTPSPDPMPLAALGVVCVAVVWLSTLVIQWPLHRRLARMGWDASLAGRLARSQWIRTTAWTVHAVSTMGKLAHHLSS